MESRPAAGAQIDCIVADINMLPMNGLEFVKAVRIGLGSVARDIPVIVGTPVSIPDYTTGMTAYQAVVTALLGRYRGQGGRHLDVSLMHSLLAYQQHAVVGVGRVVVAAEGERVFRVQPGDVRLEPLVGTTDNAALRFAVEWDGPDGVRTGVYIP